jgi:hypothetical protein
MKRSTSFWLTVSEVLVHHGGEGIVKQHISSQVGQSERETEREREREREREWLHSKVPRLFYTIIFF